MQISCPYCEHKSTVKELKPGRYKPKCPKCEKRFALSLAPDADAIPKVAVLDATAGETAAILAAPTSSSPTSSSPTSSSFAKHPGTEATLPAAHASTVATPQSPAPATPTSPASPPTRPATAAPARPKAPAEKPLATMDHFATQAATGIAANETIAHRATEETASAKTNLDALASDAKPTGIPDVLGGYRIVKELGRGAMGAVYLAKQISLNRNVALKVIQAQWAQNPVFIARFVREAYAAAQLTHHNVVQIYDLGNEGNTNFFSMEFVSGQSLSELVEKHGKLDPEQAVGYVLQAARGLAFAHNQGMVHRDAKPANMMVNDQGIVKVADLGLVKTPQISEDEVSVGNSALKVRVGQGSGGTSLAAATANVTMTDIAMGTPAYMAPEQAENAAGVDHRADIYSLGCSLYVLLTGKPPFQGSTIMEVITKHRTAAAVRPDVVVKRIPPALSELVLKMIAKRPEDRYQNLEEVIRECEQFLGVATVGTFSPSESQVETLEQSQKSFNASPSARIRSFAIAGILASSAVFAGLCLVLSWSWSTMFALLGVSFAFTYFLLSGLRGRTYLFGKAREYIASLRISDWLTAAAALILGTLILFLTNWIWLGILGIVLGVGLAAVVHFVIDAKVDAERKPAADTVNSMLKSMRIKGVDEQSLQSFVAKYSSDHWEELFESLFGYEAKLSARALMARTSQVKPRPKFRAWRERVISLIESKLKADREARDRRTLQRIEEADLKAQGMDEMQARRRAADVADAMIEAASQQRQQASLATIVPQSGSAATLDPKVIASQRRARQFAMLAAARSGKTMSKRTASASSLVTGPVALLLGGKVRFLAGALLLTVLALSLRDAGAVEAVKNVAQGGGDITQITQQGMSTVTNLFNATVSIPWLGEFNRLHVATAGVLLIFLGLFRGWKMTLFAWPAAAIALFAGSFLPSGLGIPQTMESLLPCAAATVVAVVGLVLGRSN